MTEYRSPTSHAFRIGGVMRCCIKTLDDAEFTKLPVDGDVLPCKYCTASLRYRDGAWERNND